MNHLLSRVAGWLLVRSGLATLSRWLMPRRGVFVLEFHGVASRLYPELPPAVRPHLCGADFERILTWLRARFSLLSPFEFLGGSKEGVLLTFDDGFANNEHVVVPILERYHAPAVFFVTLQHVVDPRDWLPAVRRAVASGWGSAQEVGDPAAVDLLDGMSEDQLRRCAAHPLVTIGSHTITHPLLSRCDDAGLRRELTLSRTELRRICGQPVDLLAYPTGDYDRRVVAAAADAGYRAAFVERSRGLGLPLFEIPRVGIYAAGPTYLAAKLSGLHERPLRRRRLAS